MTVFVSIAFAVMASALIHVSIRHASGTRRRAGCAGALVLFAAGVFWMAPIAGLWPAFYSELAVFFLACMILPWIDLWWRTSRVS